MNCTPQALLQAAACYRCIPKPVMRASMISLLCEWANHLTPPVEPFTYEPQSALITWTDGAGVHVGDLATFYAVADLSTTSNIQASGLGLTSMTHVGSLPALQVLNVSGNSITTLDVVGSALLQTLDCSNNLITSLDVTTCHQLTLLACSLNTMFTLDIHGLSNLLNLVADDCAGLTALDVTGTGLSFISCNSCDLTGTFDVTPCASSLTTLSCTSMFNLTAVVATGCASLTTLNCSSNPSLTTLTLTGCAALTLLTANNCDLTGVVDLSGLPLGVFEADNNVNLTSLIAHAVPCDAIRMSGCTSCTSLDLLGSNQIGDLRFSNCPVSAIVLPATFGPAIDNLWGDGAALSQALVDGLLALLVATGAVAGTCHLDGGTNAQPTNCTDVNTLRGPLFWTVTVNGPC